MIRTVLFGVNTRARDFWKLPFARHVRKEELRLVSGMNCGT